MKAAAFYNGVSGLKAFTYGMQTVSDNLANSNTVGFKSSRADFADTLYSSLADSSSALTTTSEQVGTGSYVAFDVQMTQAALDETGNTLDLAISGNGFFTVSMPDEEAVYYTRAGQFSLDGTEGQEGFIINEEGYRLQGYAVDAEGNPVLDALVDLQVPTADMDSEATANVGVAVNLNPEDGDTFGTAASVDPDDSKTYNYSTTLEMYDADGNIRDIQAFFQQIDDYSGDVPEGGESVWKVSTFEYDSGTFSANPADPGNSFYLHFDTSGNLVGITNSEGAYVDADTIALTFDFGDAQAVNIDFAPDGASTSMQANYYENLYYAADGNTIGTLSSIDIADDGTITAYYNNDQNAVIGFLALSTFASSESLDRIGSNLWSATEASGEAQTGLPTDVDLALGEVISGSLEASNVDTSEEMTNMIWYQRAYQANSKIVSTYNEMLEKAISMKS